MKLSYHVFIKYFKEAVTYNQNRNRKKGGNTQHWSCQETIILLTQKHNTIFVKVVTVIVGFI